MQHRLRQSGFTLIEMMVAVSIFAIVLVVSVGTLIVVIGAGSVAQTTQSIMSNVSFALDDMSRTIRTGHTYYCAASVGSTLPSTTQDCTAGSNVLVFTDGVTGNRMAYRFTNHTIEQRTGSGPWIRILSEDVYIESMKFVVWGSAPLFGANNTMQPQVRVLIIGRPTDTAIEDANFSIQTTLTSRSIDL